MTALKTLKTLTVCVLLWSAFACCGCGPYTMKDQYRPGIKTVFVPIWTRGTEVYRRELEMRLTKALVQRIELDTPYKTTTKDRADTELRGQIKLISQRILSRNPDTGLPREIEAIFTLDFTWKDLRNGKVLVEHSNFQAVDNYMPDCPFNEDFFQGSEAAINRIARRVVETMEAEW